MNDLKLYQIADKFNQLMDKATSEEMTQEEYDELGKELAEQLQTKSTNIIAYYENQNALLEGVDAQIKRLQSLKKATQNKIDSYKEYVKNNMERLGITKIETELGTLSIAKNPTSVEILDEEFVPDEYKQEIVTVKIDKSKIKADYKATGIVPDGVKIVDNKTRLNVR